MYLKGEAAVRVRLWVELYDVCLLQPEGEPAQAEAGRRGDGERGREEHGSRAGDEVVQLYVSHQGSAVARPIEELKGFERVNLKPGEMRTVTMKLPASALAYWDDGSKKMVVEADRVQVSVGGSSDKLPLHTVVQVARSGGRQVQPQVLRLRCPRVHGQLRSG